MARWDSVATGEVDTMDPTRVRAKEPTESKLDGIAEWKARPSSNVNNRKHAENFRIKSFANISSGIFE